MAYGPTAHRTASSPLEPLLTSKDLRVTLTERSEESALWRVWEAADSSRQKAGARNGTWLRLTASLAVNGVVVADHSS